MSERHRRRRVPAAGRRGAGHWIPWLSARGTGFLAGGACCGAFGSALLRFLEAIALPVDCEDLGAVHQAVDEGDHAGGIGEDLVAELHGRFGGLGVDAGAAYVNSALGAVTLVATEALPPGVAVGALPQCTA